MGQQRRGCRKGGKGRARLDHRQSRPSSLSLSCNNKRSRILKQRRAVRQRSGKGCDQCLSRWYQRKVLLTSAVEPKQSRPSTVTAPRGSCVLPVRVEYGLRKGGERPGEKGVNKYRRCFKQHSPHVTSAEPWGRRREGASGLSTGPPGSQQGPGTQQSAVPAKDLSPVHSPHCNLLLKKPR